MNLKGLIEKRNALLEERDGIVGKAEAETRAFEEVELTRMEEIKKEVGLIDKSIVALEETQKLEKRDLPKQDSVEEAETRAFENYIRGQIAETSFSMPLGVSPWTTVAYL